jgi:hypothetical protein
VLALGSVYIYHYRFRPLALDQHQVLATVDARNSAESVLKGRQASFRSEIGIDMQFRYARQQGGRTLYGSDANPVLTSDDSYYLKVTTGEQCYVYVFQRDSKNAVQRLFPNPAWVKSSNPMFPGETRIPAQDQKNNWFYLDETVGTEVIYLLASRLPQRDLENASEQDLLEILHERSNVKSAGDVYKEFRFKHLEKKRETHEKE